MAVGLAFEYIWTDTPSVVHEPRDDERGTIRTAHRCLYSWDCLCGDLGEASRRPQDFPGESHLGLERWEERNVLSR